MGLMAGLPGFATHGSDFHLGAHCQKGKLLDVPGTEPPLGNAVVKCKQKFWLSNIWKVISNLINPFQESLKKMVNCKTASLENANIQTVMSLHSILNHIIMMRMGLS